MKLQYFARFFLFLAVGSTAFGQDDGLIIVPSEAFSEAAVSLPLPGDVKPSLTTIVPNSSADRIFYKWGITLRGSGSTLPIIEHVPNMGSINPPFDSWRIVNSGSPNAGRPLIIDFDIPARRVGFDLASDPEGTTVSAFDSNGVLLGTIDGNQLGRRKGVESTGMKGISKLVIDYGDVAQEETIYDLVVEFVSGPRAFELYIPQVGDGQVLGDGHLTSLKSVLRISNLQPILGGYPPAGRIGGRVDFFDSDGQPLGLYVSSVGQMAVTTSLTSIEFSLDPAETLVISTGGGSDPMASGYARIRSEGPVVATSEFTVLDAEGKITTGAGISAVGPVLRSMGAVASSLEASFDSAVALVNPSEGETANVRIILVFESDFAETKEVLLEPGQHVARFMRELFPSLPEEFEGSLIISADTPIAATTLRTRDGLPLSSLQLDSLELASSP